MAAAIRMAGDKLGHLHLGEQNRLVPGIGTLPWAEIGQMCIRDSHGGNPGAFSGENKNPRHGLCLGRGFLAL